MPGPSGSDTQTTTNEPWEVQRPFLERIFKNAGLLYDQGELGALGGQSNLTNLARGATAAQALTGGSGVVNNATGLANATLGGGFLGASGIQNPFLQDAISFAQQPAIDAFNEQIAPGIDATFSGTGGAGALGSRAFAAARNRAEDTLARNLLGTSAQVGANAYESERARQQQLIGLAPGLDAAGYQNLDRLAGVGSQLDARSQQQASQPFNALSQFSQLINSTPSFGTQTTTGPSNQPNPFTQGLGGALALGSLFFGR